MLADERIKRQTELENIIKKLSEAPLDERKIREAALQLLEIYKGDFRHSYSTFFPIILRIAQSDDESNLDYLSNNLESLRAYAEEDYISGIKEFEELYEHLEKLSDHLNLEIGRWNYYSQNESKIVDISIKTDTLAENINNETKRLEEATKSLRRASKQAASIQTELITVLSIFAAIVITLSGGFTFLGSVMTSINGVEYIESVVLVALVCGLVIFNTIFLMMYLVGKITERNIYARCLTENCTCEGKQREECSSIRRIQKRLPYVFYFNLAAVCGIVIDCLVWLVDIKGYF